MTAVGSDGSPAAQVQWLDWDGHVLRWRLSATAPAVSALCIDSVPFQRFTEATEATFAVEFEYSPTGNAELEFSVACGGGSPLARWRVRHADAAVRGVDQWTQAPARLAPLAGTPRLPARPVSRLPGVAVIVPIFNAAGSVGRCLAALERWTPPSVRRILVDDASTETDVASLLDACTARANVRIERHATNRGYTAAVNTGIAAAGDDDVVLLNSDTEVGPRWLESLRLAAWSDERIGTATAVSDNAGAFSVPELEQYCPIPPRWSLVETQRAVLQQAGLRFPELPTGNGFCMFVKRELIASIGAMDAAAFPAGYGEENDFCQRAIAAGYRNVIAGNVLVRHERSASFGAARRATLGEQGMGVLRRRYPRYEADIAATLFSFDRRVLDYRVRRTYAGGDPDYASRAPRPRLLVATGDSSVPAAARADGDYELLVLHEQPQLRLLRVGADGSAAEAARAGAAIDPDETIRQWLLAHAIEGVEAGTGGAFATSVRTLAAEFGIPAVAAASNARPLV